MPRLLDRLLEYPWVYRLQTAVLAPGAEAAIVRRIETLLRQLPPAQRLVDVDQGVMMAGVRRSVAGVGHAHVA